MRALRQQARRVIFAAINGHQTYARTGPSDTGRTIADEFGQCKCLACIIARAADIGYAECMHQRHRASRRQMTEIDRQDREWWEQQKRDHPEWDEVPF
jgi:hypothetical protein